MKSHKVIPGRARYTGTFSLGPLFSDPSHRPVAWTAPCWKSLRDLRYGPTRSRKMFATMFAGRCRPMRSFVIGTNQWGSTKRGVRTGPLVFSVRCASPLRRPASSSRSPRRRTATSTVMRAIGSRPSSIPHIWRQAATSTPGAGDLHWSCLLRWLSPKEDFKGKHASQHGRCNSSLSALWELHPIHDVTAPVGPKQTRRGRWPSTHRASPCVPPLPTGRGGQGVRHHAAFGVSLPPVPGSVLGLNGPTTFRALAHAPINSPLSPNRCFTSPSSNRTCSGGRHSIEIGTRAHTVAPARPRRFQTTVAPHRAS